MNIIELCLSSGLGGLEIYTFRCSEALRKNHNVLAVLNKSSKLIEHFAEYSDINTTELKYARSFAPVSNARRLANILDNNDIDVIHVHWNKDLAMAALAKKLSHRKPALIYTRQMKITRSKNDFYHRMVYSQVDLILTINKKMAEQCQHYIGNISPDSIKNLYHGVKEPEHFLTENEINNQRALLKIDKNHFLVGLIGRLEHGKGQYLLIEAVKKAREKSSNIHGLIVGHEMAAGYKNTLIELAESLDIKDHITFHDFVKEPQTLMQICDCVALTSHEETFGLVLPEAMRSGVAVIGSNRGGVLEIIDHMKTGLLFESCNSDDLCKQILSLHSNPELCEQLAKSGKIKADTVFNVTNHMQSLEQFFTEINNMKSL